MPSHKQSVRRARATNGNNGLSCKSASKDMSLKTSIGAIAATSMVPLVSQLAGDFVGGPTHVENHMVLGKGPLSMQLPQSAGYMAAPLTSSGKRAMHQGSTMSHKVALAVGGLSTAAAMHRRYNSEEGQTRFKVACAASLLQTKLNVQAVDANGIQQQQQLEKLLAIPCETNPGIARSTPEVHVNSTILIIPEEVDLVALYKDLEEDNGGGGGLAISQLTEAIKKLNEKYLLGLPEDYACQFALFLKKIQGRTEDMIFPVQQEEFVAGVRMLAMSLHALSKQGVYLEEVRHLLVHAYKDLASSVEGEVSPEELTAAMISVGMDVQTLLGDVATCQHFLCLSNKDREMLSHVAGDSWLEESKKVVEDKLQELFGMKQMKQISRIWDDISKSAMAPGTIQEKAQRALATAWDEADHLIDITEGVVDAAGIAVAVAYLQNQVQETLTNGNLEDFDLLATVPLGLFLSVAAASAAQGYADLAPQEMTINEALLYGRIFSKHNFSQSEFRQLISCPGCCWRTAESGETISDEASSSSLKLIVNGRAAVMQGSGASSKRIGWLTPGSTIGELLGLLQERTHWQQETIVAVEPMVYVEWDLPQLQSLLAIKATLSNKLESFLVVSMAETVKQVMRSRGEASESTQWSHEDCVKFHLEKLKKDQAITLREFCNLVDQTGLARALCLTDNQVMKLFQRLDVNQDAAVSVEEMRLALPLLDRFHLNWKQDAQQLVRPLLEGSFSQECLSFVSEKLNFGTTQTDVERLRAYLEVDQDTEMNIIQVLTKLNGICEVQASLRGVSLTELMMVISRAFEEWDANGDGVMDLDEFQMMNRELRLNLSEEQVTMLHNFFDADKDGSVIASEWTEGCLNPNSVVHVLRGTLQDHVQRKGFDHLQYLLATMKEIATSPQDVGQKLKRIAAQVRDNTTQLADMLNGGLDFVSFPAALSGIYKELSGVETLDQVDGLDIAPFLIFSGLTLVSILRRLAQGQVSDMLGHEAFLYGKVFEAEGITVSEFKKMLEKWGATWRTIKQGGIVSQGSDRQLQIIAVGSCSLSTRGEVQRLVNAGHFLGEEQFLDDSKICEAHGTENTISAPIAMALEDTTVVSWDIPTLKSHLESNAELPGHERLEMQLRHLVTMSYAHKLLHKP